MIFRGKSRQNAENKQTFGLTGKIEIDEKSRSNVENKQMTGIFRVSGNNNVL